MRLFNMTNFYNSGLYTQPFFKKTSNLVFSQDFLSDTLRDNYDVFFKHYYSEIETEGKSESQICIEMMDLILIKTSGDLLCFQPLIFKADIALKCGLIPLVTPDIKIHNNILYHSCNHFINIIMLATSAGEEVQIKDLFPRLDAYQVLTDNRIDKYSSLFQDAEHFISSIGKSPAKKF
jgi:hypothetical protein